MGLLQRLNELMPGNPWWAPSKHQTQVSCVLITHPPAWTWKARLREVTTPTQATHAQLQRHPSSLFSSMQSHRWRRKWQPIPIFLPRKSHGQKSLQSMGPQKIGNNWLNNRVTEAGSSLGGQERSHIFPRLDKLCLFFPLDKVLHVAVPRKGLCPGIQAPNLDWAQLPTISFHRARYSASRCLCHGAAYMHIVHVLRWARPELLPGRHISLTLCPCGPEQKPAQSRPPQNIGRMKEHWGLPWWLRGKEPACQCRRRGFNPWSERIPCTLKQWSPCTTTIEWGSCNRWTHVLQLQKPARPGARAPQQEKPLPWEACAPQLESSHYSQLEKSPTSSEDTAQSKLK